MRSRWNSLAVLSSVAALAVVVLAAHNVPTELTVADRASADRIMQQAGYGAQWKDTLKSETFEDQVKAVLAVQDAVITVTPKLAPIPFDVPREPADILVRSMGQCSERSRAIEKLLKVLGVETRHASIYSTAETGSRVISLLTPRVLSHAVTEAKTLNGWMVVDSNNRWIGLTHDNRTVSLHGLKSVDHNTVKWSGLVSDPPHMLMRGPYTYVIGLYSRHGRFYAPFTPVPDINWRDFLFGQFN